MVTTPEPRRERAMELLVVAIIAIAGLGIYRSLRTRTAD
jgi:hypothetical protein